MDELFIPRYNRYVIDGVYMQKAFRLVNKELEDTNNKFAKPYKESLLIPETELNKDNYGLVIERYSKDKQEQVAKYLLVGNKYVKVINYEDTLITIDNIRGYIKIFINAEHIVLGEYCEKEVLGTFSNLLLKFLDISVLEIESTVDNRKLFYNSRIQRFKFPDNIGKLECRYLDKAFSRFSTMKLTLMLDKLPKLEGCNFLFSDCNIGLLNICNGEIKSTLETEQLFTHCNIGVCNIKGVKVKERCKFKDIFFKSYIEIIDASELSDTEKQNLGLKELLIQKVFKLTDDLTISAIL